MNFQRKTVVRKKKVELSCPQIKCLLDERMKTKIFFFLHPALSMASIGAFVVSVKYGRCLLTNDTSSKSSHAVQQKKSAGCTGRTRNIITTE